MTESAIHLRFHDLFIGRLLAANDWCPRGWNQPIRHGDHWVYNNTDATFPVDETEIGRTPQDIFIKEYQNDTTLEGWSGIPCFKVIFPTAKKITSIPVPMNKFHSTPVPLP